MSEYQALQGQLAVVTLLAVVPLVALILVRRRAVAPLVTFGAAVLLVRAGGQALVYVGSGTDAPPPVVQVVIDYVRGAPSALLIIYACLVQARRYRTARNNDRLRWWFLRAPLFYGGAWLGAFALDLAIRPPLLDNSLGIPWEAYLAETPRRVFATAYACLASYVFFTAVKPRSGPLASSQRLQNFFWGIALGTFGFLSAYAFVWRGFRAFAPERLTAEVVALLSSVQFVAQVLVEASLVLGILAYYAQSRRGRFLERFLDFLGLVGDLAEELANAPLSKGRVAVAYTAMHEAAGSEFLNLSAAERKRMDNAFLAKAVLEHRTGGRMSRSRLWDLVRAYEDEVSDPVLARGLLKEAREEQLPDTLKDLLRREDEGSSGLGEALAVAAKTEEGVVKLASAPEWEQLVYVALADGGLLSGRQSDAVLREAVFQEGSGVSEKVLDAYRLAQLKVKSYRGAYAPRGLEGRDRGPVEEPDGGG